MRIARPGGASIYALDGTDGLDFLGIVVFIICSVAAVYLIAFAFVLCIGVEQNNIPKAQAAKVSVLDATKVEIIGRPDQVSSSDFCGGWFLSGELLAFHIDKHCHGFSLLPRSLLLQLKLGSRLGVVVHSDDHRCGATPIRLDIAVIVIIINVAKGIPVICRFNVFVALSFTGAFAFEPGCHGVGVWRRSLQVYLVL